MKIPKGLRKPHRIAELAPVVLALIGAAIAAFFAILHIAQGGDVKASSTALLGPIEGPHPAGSMFQPEMLYSAGALVLFFALALGVWLYQRSHRADEPMTVEPRPEAYRSQDL